MEATENTESDVRNYFTTVFSECFFVKFEFEFFTIFLYFLFFLKRIEHRVLFLLSWVNKWRNYKNYKNGGIIRRCESLLHRSRSTRPYA